MTARQTERELDRLAVDYGKLRERRAKVGNGLVEHLADHPRELAVLMLRYGVAGSPQTLEQAGDMLGVSRERARQLENRGRAILAGKVQGVRRTG